MQVSHTPVVKSVSVSCVRNIALSSNPGVQPSWEEMFSIDLSSVELKAFVRRILLDYYTAHSLSV